MLNAPPIKMDGTERLSAYILSIKEDIEARIYATKKYILIGIDIKEESDANTKRIS